MLVLIGKEQMNNPSRCISKSLEITASLREKYPNMELSLIRMTLNNFHAVCCIYDRLYATTKETVTPSEEDVYAIQVMKENIVRTVL